MLKSTGAQAHIMSTCGFWQDFTKRFESLQDKILFAKVPSESKGFSPCNFLVGHYPHLRTLPDFRILCVPTDTSRNSTNYRAGVSMTLEELQSAILAAIARRDELVSEAREKRRQSAEAEYAYTMAFSSALIKNVEGKNAETRKAQALIAVDAELFRHKLTEAESDGLKMAVAAKADEISALQTLIRLQMTELDALRYGQHNQA